MFASFFCIQGREVRRYIFVFLFFFCVSDYYSLIEEIMINCFDDFQKIVDNIHPKILDGIFIQSFHPVFLTNATLGCHPIENEQP